VRVAPIPASSGRANRHRLSRGGDRDANRALHLLALGRMGWDPATRTYVTRRTAAGLSKPEIIRCLKRYLAREICRILVKPPLRSRAQPMAGPSLPESLLTNHRSIWLAPLQRHFRRTSPHTVRHSCVEHALDAGADLVSVSALLHEDRHLHYTKPAGPWAHCGEVGAEVMDEKDLDLYLDEVRRVPEVRGSAAVELWRVVERGGSEAKLARDRLIEANLGLAAAVAKKYLGRGLPLGDLIEASNMGLLRAVERFDHRKGIPFSGYAVWWMRRDIESALERAQEQQRE
jgi:hypothetical protein